MPIQDDIGYGEYTDIKIRHLAKIFEMHLSITRAVLNKNRYYTQTYHYVDATAGKGRTPDGTTGSPLLFLEKVEQLQMNYRADFIERNENNLAELQVAIQREAHTNSWRISNLKFHHDDYETTINSLFSAVNQKELGLVFVDPSGDLPNFDSLALVAKMRPKLDILIYVSAANIKRLYKINHKLLSDYMSTVGKKYWLIRKPIDGDSHQWTFMLGSNTDIFDNYKSIDFIRLDSKDAQSFWPLLNLSTKQRFRQIQPSLPNLLDDEDE
jgi:three-Cys-motif partner protein